MTFNGEDYRHCEAGETRYFQQISQTHLITFPVGGSRPLARLGPAFPER